MPRKGKVPGYLKHKATGQVIVLIEGRFIYLGKYGSDESHTKCQRVISEWRGTHAAPRYPSRSNGMAELTITELIAAYWDHLLEYYGDTGSRRGTANHYKPTLRSLRQFYADELAANFGGSRGAGRIENERLAQPSPRKVGELCLDERSGHAVIASAQWGWMIR